MSAADPKAFVSEDVRRAEWHLVSVFGLALAHEEFETANRPDESRDFDYVLGDTWEQRSFFDNPPKLAEQGINDISRKVTLAFHD